MKVKRTLRYGEIRCDEQMARHKPIFYLYHLQRPGSHPTKSTPLLGHCNEDCAVCPCGMIQDESRGWRHIPKDILANSPKCGATKARFFLEHGR